MVKPTLTHYNLPYQTVYLNPTEYELKKLVSGEAVIHGLRVCVGDCGNIALADAYNSTHTTVLRAADYLLKRHFFGSANYLARRGNGYSWSWDDEPLENVPEEAKETVELFTTLDARRWGYGPIPGYGTR